MNEKYQRTRIVSFRASPEEFDSLQRFSANSGARSVSEFARSVACREHVEPKTPDVENLDSKLENLHQTVAALHEKIELLTEILVKKDE